MDVPRLRVANLKMLIAAVPIRLTDQVAIERRNVFYEFILKYLHVFPFLFAAQELPPGVEQIIGGNDIVV